MESKLFLASCIIIIIIAKYFLINALSNQHMIFILMAIGALVIYHRTYVSKSNLIPIHSSLKTKCVNQLDIGDEVVVLGLKLRPVLYQGLKDMKKIRSLSQGSLQQGIEKLDNFFEEVDTAIMVTNNKSKYTNFLRLHLQSLKDKRADALNSLHGLHYSVTSKRDRKQMYMTIQLARLESLRALSSLVTKYKRHALRVFEFDLDAPMSVNANDLNLELFFASTSTPFTPVKTNSKYNS